MSISDWSSDVCSSDLRQIGDRNLDRGAGEALGRLAAFDRGRVGIVDRRHDLGRMNLAKQLPADPQEQQTTREQQADDLQQRRREKREADEEDERDSPPNTEHAPALL